MFLKKALDAYEMAWQAGSLLWKWTFAGAFFATNAMIIIIYMQYVYY
jgi:hypothetical protein